MNPTTEAEPTPMKSPTKTERTSDRDLVTTRTFDAPARLVFQAWTKSELFAKWWVPKSHPLNLVSCEIDARVGGKYKLVFRHEGGDMAFFGTYLEITPNTRLVWTNEEGEGGGAVTTVTLEEKDGKTLLTMRDRHPTKEALDAALADGSCEGIPETFQQLADFLALSSQSANA